MSIAQDNDTVISAAVLLTAIIPQDHAYRKLNRLINLTIHQFLVMMG